MPSLRYVHAAVAALFVLGVLTQFFLAGMAVFGAGRWATHIDVGYTVAAVPALLLLVAWPARVGRRLVLLTVATLVAAQVQTMLPLLRHALPVVAALHPVNATLVLGLGIAVLRRSWALARAVDGGTPEPARVATVAPSGR